MDRIPAQASSEATRAATRRDGAARKAGIVSAGGLVAALAAASCCVVPFVLFTIGVSGAWIANFTALEPYQPFFAALAFAFLAYGFHLIYRAPRKACTEDSYCAAPRSNRIAKMGLWAAVILVLIALGFPKLAPLFL